MPLCTTVIFWPAESLSLARGIVASAETAAQGGFGPRRAHRAMEAVRPPSWRAAFRAASRASGIEVQIEGGRKKVRGAAQPVCVACGGDALRQVDAHAIGGRDHEHADGSGERHASRPLVEASGI